MMSKALKTSNYKELYNYFIGDDSNLPLNPQILTSDMPLNVVWLEKG